MITKGIQNLDMSKQINYGYPFDYFKCVIVVSSPKEINTISDVVAIYLSEVLWLPSFLITLAFRICYYVKI